jgi:hypothetical protein
VAAAAAAVYIVLLITIPLVEPGFDMLRAHPEDYAAGQYGVLVNVSYAAMAVALAALTAGLLPGGRWSRLALVLLAPPIALCVALAIDPMAVARQTVTLYTVLGLAVGPLVVSLAFHERFRARGRWVVMLAVVVLVAFMGLAAAPAEVSGTVNRAFDVAAGLWVVVAALSGLRPHEPAASA